MRLSDEQRTNQSEGTGFVRGGRCAGIRLLWVLG